jgi:hypothetical protein
MFTSVFNFLDKIFQWDADQGLFAKILTVVFGLFGIALILILIGSSYGIGNNLIAQAHKAGHGGSETLFATLFFAGAAFWGWINFTDRIPFKVNDMVVIITLLVLIILGVNANTGFFGHVR